jgi:hypothetical protein
MEIEHADELLEVVVEDGVIEPRVHIVQVWCDDGMALDKVDIHTGCFFEG